LPPLGNAIIREPQGRWEGFAFGLEPPSHTIPSIHKPVLLGVQASSRAEEQTSLLWGLLGVAAFSLTLPFTRLAVESLEPSFVALGRVLLAAICGALYLWSNKARRPTAEEFRRLIVVALGVVLGFPFLTTYAMRDLPAAHGAVVTGLLPLATAVAGVVLARERPAPMFWLFAALGSGLVVLFALLKGGGRLEAADFLLLGAIVAAAVGYAEGAKLSRSLGGLAVISWALVLASPIFAVLMVRLLGHYAPSAPPPAWVAFLYISLVSQFLGFLAWYRGLALGGIARVGQTQLLQPFLTLIGAALLLGEHLDVTTILFALAIVVVVALGRRVPIR